MSPGLIELDRLIREGRTDQAERLSRTLLDRMPASLVIQQRLVDIYLLQG